MKKHRSLFRRAFILCIAAGVLALVVAPAQVVISARALAREVGMIPWQRQVQAYVDSDRASSPATRGIVFIGSSTIGGWDLDRFFPGMPVINRGFGGSHLSDVIFYADVLAIPYRPSALVVYAGENDIFRGQRPHRVAADFTDLAATVHEALPETHIFFLAIKPSLARWHLYPEIVRANDLIRAVARTNARVHFIDVATPMLARDGRPRPELFQPDGLHLNERGYQLWTSLLHANVSFLQATPVSAATVGRGVVESRPVTSRRALLMRGGSVAAFDDMVTANP